MADRTKMLLLVLFAGWAAVGALPGPVAGVPLRAVAAAGTSAMLLRPRPAP